MKKHIINNSVAFSLIIFILLQFISCTCTPTESESPEVIFHDSNFEILIREILEQPEGKITEDDMLSIEVINGGYREIEDITGIQYCKNIKIIVLSNNKIDDISFLSGLDQLWYLELRFNTISDISSISKLRELKELIINNNQISDISAVSGMHKMINLFLHENQISDIFPIVRNSGLEKGVVVELRNNPLNSISLNNYIPKLLDRGIIVHYTKSSTGNNEPEK